VNRGELATKSVDRREDKKKKKKKKTMTLAHYYREKKKDKREKTTTRVGGQEEGRRFCLLSKERRSTISFANEREDERKCPMGSGQKLEGEKGGGGRSFAQKKGGQNILLRKRPCRAGSAEREGTVESFAAGEKKQRQEVVVDPKGIRRSLRGKEDRRAEVQSRRGMVGKGRWGTEVWGKKRRETGAGGGERERREGKGRI